MKFRVEVICVNDDGTEQRCDVVEMERRQLAMETLGLSVADGKAILHEVQDFVASQQMAEDLKCRRNCPNCGQQYHSKGTGTHTIQTVFGPVPVPNPRWERCSCQTEGPKTFRPSAAWLRGRTSPELLYLETKWGSLIPFEKVSDLLKEVLPVGESTNHETVREHLQRIAERMEAELGEERQPQAFEDRGEQPAAGWAHDGGDRWRLRASGPQGRLFRSDRRQERGGLSTGGRGPGAAVEMLRLCADLRREAAAAALGVDEIARDARESAGGIHVRRRRRCAAGAGVPAPQQRTHHRLVSHHNALTVLQQQTKALQEEEACGAEVSKQVESVKHLLWHGNVDEALERLGNLFIDLDPKRKRSAPDRETGGWGGRIRDLHWQQPGLHTELRGAVPARGNDQHRVRGIDHQPGSEQTVCQETANAVDASRGAPLVTDPNEGP